MKILHCADIHLGSSLETHLDETQAKDLRNSMLKSFSNMVEKGSEQGARLVLIAGDLFDSSAVDRKTEHYVLDTVRQHPEMDFLCLSGNHDGGFAFSNEWKTLPNFKPFSSEEWTSYSYDDGNGKLTVSGYGGSLSEKVLESFPQTEGTHLAVLHGQISSSYGEDRIVLRSLAGKGIDYLALGHYHTYQTGKLDSRGLYAYSGCLSGRGFDECGEHGYVCLDIDVMAMEGSRVRMTFCPLPGLLFRTVSVDLSEAHTLQDIEKIAKKTLDASASAEDAVKVILTGNCDPDLELDIPYLLSEWKGKYYFLKIQNDCRLAISPESYREDISLRGEFVRQVMASDLPEEKKDRILQYGLAALRGEELAL